MGKAAGALLALPVVAVLVLVLVFAAVIHPEEQAAANACPGGGVGPAPLPQGPVAVPDPATKSAPAGAFELPGPSGETRSYTKGSTTPIPADMKGYYVAAGKKFGIPWELLAGLFRSETDHGRNTNTSSAGAQGPGQWIPKYWPAYAQDGDGDGDKDILSKPDAVYTTAYRLSIEGARKSPEGVRQALFSYNRAWWYVNDVLSWARDYAQGKVVVTPGEGSEAGCAPVTNSGMNCPATKLAAEKGLKPNALRVLRCVKQQFPEYTQFEGVTDRPANPKSDHPQGLAVDVMTGSIDGGDYTSQKATTKGWALSRWLEKNASKLGVKYLIYYGKVWTTKSRSWEAYTHPSGASDDTSAHKDHVHVSVNAGDVGAGNVAVSGKFTSPLRGKYRISSGFGMRLHPIQKVWRLHDGIDLVAPEGTPIYSGCSGRVAEVVAGWGTGGNMTRVDCGGGASMRYLHQQRHATSVGASVKAGTLIGYLGNTGGSTGAHLHFTVLVNGQPVDPAPWMKARGAPL